MLPPLVSPHITAVWYNMAAVDCGLPAVASAHWIFSLFSHESSLNTAQVHLLQSEMHPPPSFHTPDFLFATTFLSSPLVPPLSSACDLDNNTSNLLRCSSQTMCKLGNARPETTPMVVFPQFHNYASYVYCGPQSMLKSLYFTVACCKVKKALACCKKAAFYTWFEQTWLMLV